MAGTLYLCATPIGNMEDITIRAIRTLKEVDIIAAEDTRTSMKLLDHYDIHTPLTSYHEHNKYEKGEKLVARLLAGEDVALITDAGTPGISDPGEDLVKRCLEEEISVSAVPGASACITALTISGLPTGRFAFEAFLPTENKKREQILSELKRETRTIVIYEAPHRLVKTLRLLAENLGEAREVVICRELTKRHETRYPSTLGEAAEYFEANEPKGECVLVIEGADRKRLQREDQEAWEQLSVEEHMEHYLSQGMDKKEAMRQVAMDRGVSRRDIYQETLKDQS